jgi:putative transposase
MQWPTPRKLKRARPAAGSEQRHKARQPHQDWAMETSSSMPAQMGGGLSYLNVNDDHSRLYLTIRVGRLCKVNDVVVVMEELTTLYAPAFNRSDNRPEFVANAIKLWCEKIAISTVYIQPGSPWQNDFDESLNIWFRAEFLNIELLTTVAEALALIDCWRREYTTLRPHSALQGCTLLEAGQLAPG